MAKKSKLSVYDFYNHCKKCNLWIENEKLEKGICVYCRGKVVNSCELEK